MMINISRHYQGKHVRCTIFPFDAPMERSANEALVYVNVPVKNFSITSTPTSTIKNGILSVCENVNISLHYKTSVSRPAAIIRWIYQSTSSTGDITTVPVIGNTSVREDNGLFITSGTLYITTNRSLNGWHIFCSSTNYPDIIVNSSSIDFDILYPPENSPTILNVNVTNGDIYMIIEGRQGLLTCAVPTSNPNAVITWIGLQHSHNIKTTLDYVSSDLKWVASRHDTNISTCIAKHECNNFTKSISVNIEVLYPPIIKPMKDVSIVEGSLLNKTCDITLGIPKSVTVSWTRHTDMLITNSGLLTLQNITRYSSSNYTCNVANILKPTIGIEERGESRSSLYVDVLYPPTVDPIENQTVKEGSNFNLTCPVKPGNPKTTNITWTSIDRTKQGVTQFLLFKNISRKQADTYKCTAKNMMNPTNNNRVEGHDSKSFNIIVEYSATIKMFFINGYNKDSIVTLNEHEHITFHCYVDSVPIATTDIKFQNVRELKSTNSTNSFSYNLGPATCLDAGIYQCSASNKHNSRQDDAKKHLFIFVKCSPRAYPKMQVNSNITTALNLPVELSFSAVAFPLPTVVTWQKLIGFTWTVIASYDEASIRQSNLIFNLTFSNVQQEDIGQYKLVIINDIDEFNQNFTLILADEQTGKKDKSIVAVIVGVISGCIGAFLAVVLVLWIFRKRVLIWRRKRNKDVVYQNDITVTQNDNRSRIENDHIQMHKQMPSTRQTERHLPEKVDAHDNGTNYERLDGNQRDRNEYSQLSRHNGDDINRLVVCVDSERPMEVPIYTNLKL